MKKTVTKFLILIMSFAMLLSVGLMVGCDNKPDESFNLFLSQDSVSLAIYEGPDGKYNDFGHVSKETVDAFVGGDGKKIDAKNIVWKSENENIATVKDGVISAVSLGSTTVTAQWTSENNITYTKSCKVRVYVPTIEFKKKSADVFLSSED